MKKQLLIAYLSVIAASIPQKLEQQVQSLSSPEEDLSMLPILSGQLAESLTSIPDVAAMKTQLPPNADLGMVQGNIGLQWGMHEFRYGSVKGSLAKKLSQLRTEDVRGAAREYLQAPARSVIALRSPSGQTTAR